MAGCAFVARRCSTCADERNDAKEKLNARSFPSSLTFLPRMTFAGAFLLPLSTESNYASFLFVREKRTYNSLFAVSIPLRGDGSRAIVAMAYIVFSTLGKLASPIPL